MKAVSNLFFKRSLKYDHAFRKGKYLEFDSLKQNKKGHQNINGISSLSKEFTQFTFTHINFNISKVFQYI